MFRLFYDHAVRLFSRSHANARPVPSKWALAQETRAPDPYVWRLPSPYDARWRRWARRNREAGHRLPFPRDEDCWPIPVHSGTGMPLWEAADDVVRPYVVRF
ncbi:hypothetical protein [Streptomyces sp. NPDC001604]|uniref:hypothetical protein n=1 Tax=Streptomyces sp. NPDC001604 TaxID=3364593 RepID=UPI0036A448FC